MVRVFAAFAICVWVLGAQSTERGPRDRVPRFEQFKAKVTFQGIPAKPRFTAPAVLRENHGDSEGDKLPDADERYRGSVELAAEHGPNFAGQYTIATWSCGTSCSSSVVVDACSGQLYRDTPYGTLDLSGSEYTGLSFRIDSSLLIVEGCLDTDAEQNHTPECSRSYYKWIPPRFILLRKIALPVPEWLQR